MTFVTTEFDVDMLSRFLDRDVADALNPIIRRFYMKGGARIRLRAKRLVRYAPQKKISDLNKHERFVYEQAMRDYKAGKITKKPRRPDQTAMKGNPPFAHKRPRSLLRDRIFFALNPTRQYVVIGPELVGRNRRHKRNGDVDTMQDLEAGWPFMEPAFQEILPHLPKYLQQAKGN